MKNKYIYIFLIVLILFGCFLRFYHLDQETLWNDEPYYMISALKFHHESYEAGSFYVMEHPPLARWILGIPTKWIDLDYSGLKNLGANMYASGFYVSDLLKETYVPIRFMNAIIGTLGVLFIILITRKIFGLYAGLWAGALAALSFDLISYSRHTLTDGCAFTFALGTLLFFIYYLYNKTDRRYWYLVLSLLFLILALDSRNFHPLFLIPILIISLFVIKRNKEERAENIFVSGLIFAATYVALKVIYLPEAFKAGQELYDVTIFSILQFNLHNIFITLFFRNSYLFILVLLLLLFELYLIYTNNKDNLKGLFLSKKPEMVVFIFFVIYFFGLGITEFSLQARHLLVVFIPLFIFGGYILKKYSTKKFFLAVIVGLLILNVYLLISYFPHETSNYINFGVDKYISEGSDDPEYLDAIAFLENDGNPKIITSLPNMLIFYENVDPLVMASDSRCTEAFFEQMKEDGTYMIVTHGFIERCIELQIVCPGVDLYEREIVYTTQNLEVSHFK
ncbi:MAG: glycosyltransferase family 39 protein [archaeon]